MKSVTKLHRSSAIQAYRDLLVRDFHPLVIHAARAHIVLQIGSLRQIASAVQFWEARKQGSPAQTC